MSEENKAIEDEFFDTEKLAQLNVLRKTANDMAGLVACLQLELEVAHGEYHRAAAARSQLIKGSEEWTDYYCYGHRAHGRIRAASAALQIIERFECMPDNLFPEFLRPEPPQKSSGQ